MDATDCLALFGANRALAYAGVRDVLSRYHRRLPPTLGPEDLETDALLGLWDACRWYNPSRGAFSTYAHRAIHRRVRRALAGLARHETPLSLDAPGSPDDTATLGERLPSPEPEVWEQVADQMERERVGQLMRSLPQRTARATLLWAHGCGPTEIGRELGISRQRAHQLPREGAARLRALMDLEEAA